MNKKNYKNLTKIIFISYFSLFLVTGCHTFYTIDADDLKDIGKNDVVQIIYTNGDTLHINYIKEVSIIENREIEIISYSDDFLLLDSVRIPISLSGIKEVEIEKINYPLSIGATIFFSSFFLFALLSMLIANDAFST